MLHRTFGLFTIKRLSLALLLVFLILETNIISQTPTAGQIDPSFDPVLNAFNSSVSQALVQPDGKILISGAFRSIRGAFRGGIARLNTDGTLDETFNPQFDIGALLASPRIILQPDGKILVVFGSLIRLNADGSRDQTFNPAVSTVKNALVQPDGRILVAEASGSNVNLVRLNSDGSRDQSFSLVTAAPSHPRLTFGVEMDLEPDGDVIMIGGFTTINGSPRTGAVRVNANGLVDSGFNPAAGGEQIKVLADGKILLAGNQSTVQNQPRKGIVRLNSDGTLDAGFVPATNAAAGEVSLVRFAVQTDGKIVIAGSFDLGTTKKVARLNADGSLDPTFVAPAAIGVEDGTLLAPAVQPDGKIIVVGGFKTINNLRNENVARLNSTGSLDTSFNVRDVVYFNLATAARVSAIYVQPDGKIVIGGTFRNANNYTYLSITRLNPDSTTDTSFNTLGVTNGIPIGNDPPRRVTAITAQPDGKLLIGGNFTEFNGSARNGLARLNSDGTLDNTFVANQIIASEIREIMYEPDGKIIVAGSFGVINENTRRNLVRLNSDGSTDQSFNVALPSFGTVYDVLRQPDGKYLIAGAFDTVNGVARRTLARLNNDGSLDAGFNPAISDTALVFSLVLLSDGKIIVGGYLNTVSRLFARLNPNGSLDSSFNPQGSGGVRKLYRQPDGRILVAGAQEAFNTTAFLYRINADGSLDASFANSGNVTSIDDIALQPDGKVLVGGQFTVIGGAARRGIARFFNNLTVTAARTAFDFTGDGRADVSVFRPSSGTWFRLNSADNSFFAAQFGADGDQIAPADYDGDGRTDLSVFRPTGQGDPNRAYFYIQQSSNNLFRPEQFGRQGDAPVSADFDGDGKADLAVYRAGANAGDQSFFFYRPSSQPGTDFRTIQWGAAGDKPVPADYDGDGKTDAAVFRPSSERWYILRSSDNQVTDVAFGSSGDVPTPMDFDGDGRANIAVFRPSTGWWYTSTNPATNYGGIQFGSPGDVPVAADYDGDGRADVAVFRPSNGVWYLLKTTQGFSGIQFGTQADKPAPAAYNR